MDERRVSTRATRALYRALRNMDSGTRTEAPAPAAAPVPSHGVDAAGWPLRDTFDGEC